ncbi:hypothetical protein DFJ73DRAFT_821202 [Zopfochytrium polystomum]|nr:hypothetical protein DFJ73DRAFT_821202 [Zopfochytrium polystomum]
MGAARRWGGACHHRHPRPSLHLLALLAYLSLMALPGAAHLMISGRRKPVRFKEATFGPRLPREGIVGRLVPFSLLSMRICENEHGSTPHPASAMSPVETGCFRVHKNALSKTDSHWMDDQLPYHVELSIGEMPPAAVATASSICRTTADDHLKSLGSALNSSRDLWVALILRGDCSFEEKVAAAEEAGAAAVIIGDNEKSGSLITMIPTQDKPKVLIPSVFISSSDYHDLKDRATTSQRRHQPLPSAAEDSLTHSASLRSSPEQTAVLHEFANVVLKPSNPLRDILEILVCIVLSPVLSLGFLWLSSVVGRWAKARREVASFSTLQSLPIKIVHDPLGARCPICLDDFVTGDKSRELPCKHSFHPHCVDKWLTETSGTCPLCKRTVKKLPH